MFAGHGGQVIFFFDVSLDMFEIQIVLVGIQILDIEGDEEDGLDETILPCDYRTSSSIPLILRDHCHLKALFDEFQYEVD